MIKVIVCGGRDFNNYALLTKWFDHYLQNQPDVEIVSGCAKGADTLGGFANTLQNTSIIPPGTSTFATAKFSSSFSGSVKKQSSKLPFLK